MSRREQFQKARESGFDSRFGVGANLTSYNALHDSNMRHFFENSTVQTHLYRTGQIDASGRVIDLDKNASRLHIIDKEFAFAERLAYNRLAEEEEMRRRVQLKRHQALEKARREEKLVRMKEDRQIRREIVQATREAMGLVKKEGEIVVAKKGAGGH